MRDPSAERMYMSIRALLAWLATGPQQPSIALKDLLASPQVQEMSSAADAYGGTHEWPA
jgi:hypothetical protein